MSETTISPAKSAFDPQEILLRANALFLAEQSADLRSVISENIKALQHYDVGAMDRVVAILSWGRSGSLLLSSYLDGHRDVMMLPATCGWKLYEFCEHYPSLSLHDKLLAYPAYKPYFSRFFDGDFPISSAQYYAAVQAILEFYCDWPTEFLESRRAFVLLMHIAYNLALGRPASSQPLIVYAMHESDNVIAGLLVDDFPKAKFVHTVRDPISSWDATFHFGFSTLFRDYPRAYTQAPYAALVCLVDKDQPHTGMESRTRTVRFEDLHRDTAELICDLTAWLGLPYQASLRDSTFNGIPYVVKRDRQSWSGSRVEQAQRKTRNLSLKDQAFLFAFFYDNYREWNYPCPKLFTHPMVRCLVFLTILAFPTKMELIAARGMFVRWTLPCLQQGNILPAIKSLLGAGYYRLKICGLFALVFVRRLLYPTTLLEVEHGRGPEQMLDDGAKTPRGERRQHRPMHVDEIGD